MSVFDTPMRVSGAMTIAFGQGKPAHLYGIEQPRWDLGWWQHIVSLRLR